MPVFLRYGQHRVYFWSAENGEPIHFHISNGDPAKNDTKVWLLSDGSMRLAHNKGRISERELLRVMVVMREYVSEYEALWTSVHGASRHVDD